MFTKKPFGFKKPKLRTHVEATILTVTSLRSDSLHDGSQAIAKLET